MVAAALERHSCRCDAPSRRASPSQAEATGTAKTTLVSRTAGTAAARRELWRRRHEHVGCKAPTPTKPAPTPPLNRGDMAEANAGYGPTTVNLHDVFYVVENDVASRSCRWTRAGQGRLGPSGVTADDAALAALPPWQSRCTAGQTSGADASIVVDDRWTSSLTTLEPRRSSRTGPRTTKARICGPF